MAYWVYGRDSTTGAAPEQFFSEATTEEAARAEAAAQGLIVESVELQTEEPPASALRPRCPKCRGEMVAGFVMPGAGSGMAAVKWFAGIFARGWFRNRGSETGVDMRVYRCGLCGFLEAYAPKP